MYIDTSRLIQKGYPPRPPNNPIGTIFSSLQTYKPHDISSYVTDLHSHPNSAPDLLPAGACYPPYAISHVPPAKRHYNAQHEEERSKQRHWVTGHGPPYAAQKIMQHSDERT